MGPTLPRRWRWRAGCAAGAVNVNTSVFSAYAPSGGYKQSGLGRERGPDGIREFQEVKHMSDWRAEVSTYDLRLADLGR